MGTSWELGLYYRFEYYRRQYLDRYHDLLASAESETSGFELISLKLLLYAVI